jgi:hypothetical protein
VRSNRKNSEKIYWIAGFWFIPFVFVAIYSYFRFKIDLKRILFFPYNYYEIRKNIETNDKMHRKLPQFTSMALLYVLIESFLRKNVTVAAIIGWFIRLKIFFMLVTFFLKSLKDPNYSIYILSVANFIVHELGHTFFSSPVRFIMIVGGSLSEILVPLFCANMFFKKKDYFSAFLSYGWLAYSFYQVAAYAGDAQARVLDLVPNPFTLGGLSPESILSVLDKKGHDWYNILSPLGLLPYDYVIADILRLAGKGCMLICISGCIYVIGNIINKIVLQRAK